MKDKQQVEAKQHINESQIAVLHQLLQVKESMVERFRCDFEEAIVKLEHTGSEMGKLHKDSVDAVHRVLEQEAAQTHETLAEWQQRTRTGEEMLLTNQQRIDAICARIANSFKSSRDEFVVATQRFTQEMQQQEAQRVAADAAVVREMNQQMESFKKTLERQQASHHLDATQRVTAFNSTMGKYAEGLPVPDVKGELRDLVSDVHQRAVDDVSHLFPPSTLSDNLIDTLKSSGAAVAKAGRMSVVECIPREGAIRVSAAPPAGRRLGSTSSTGPAAPLAQRNTANSMSHGAAPKRVRDDSSAADARRSGKPPLRQS